MLVRKLVSLELLWFSFWPATFSTCPWNPVGHHNALFLDHPTTSQTLTSTVRQIVLNMSWLRMLKDNIVWTQLINQLKWTTATFLVPRQHQTHSNRTAFTNFFGQSNFMKHRTVSGDPSLKTMFCWRFATPPNEHHCHYLGRLYKVASLALHMCC